MEAIAYETARAIGTGVGTYLGYNVVGPSITETAKKTAEFVKNNRNQVIGAAFIASIPVSFGLGIVYPIAGATVFATTFTAAWVNV